MVGLCVTLEPKRADWREYISQQIEKNPRAAQIAALPEDKKQAA